MLKERGFVIDWNFFFFFFLCRLPVKTGRQIQGCKVTWADEISTFDLATRWSCLVVSYNVMQDLFFSFVFLLFSFRMNIQSCFSSKKHRHHLSNSTDRKTQCRSRWWRRLFFLRHRFISLEMMTRLLSLIADLFDRKIWRCIPVQCPASMTDPREGFFLFFFTRKRANHLLLMAFQLLLSCGKS